MDHVSAIAVVLALYVSEYEPSCGRRSVISAARLVDLRSFETAAAMFRSTRPGLDVDGVIELKDERKKTRFSRVKVVSFPMSTASVDGTVFLGGMVMLNG